MPISSCSRWLIGLCAVGSLIALSGPTAAAARSAPTATHTVTAATSFTGQVRNGRPLEHARGPKIVIPNGLAVVGDAAVSLRGPGLNLHTSTNAAGTFGFRNLHTSLRACYTLTVRKAGFGRWTEAEIARTGYGRRLRS